MSDLDQALAAQYGAYASYAGAHDPERVDYFGDSPAEEVDRLLDRFVTPQSNLLDLGCGAGFTLCRLAPRAGELWGVDADAQLIAAARQRADGLANVHLVHGDTTDAATAARLPAQRFDVALSRRGPNLTRQLLAALRPGAVLIQELVQDSLGLLELFGRTSPMSRIGDNPRWLVDEYSWLDLAPVSCKEYYYESYFRDAEHLGRYLAQQYALYSWPMPPMPYDGRRDGEALRLYARYNATPHGIRIIGRRNVYLFRRAPVQYAPADPAVQPML